jgi:hypothetical protein
MLYASLILSTILFLLSQRIVRTNANPGCTLALIPAAMVPFFMVCIMPAAALQSLFLCAAAIYRRKSRPSPGSFVPLSLGVTAVAYGLAGILVVQSEGDYARLRNLYPSRDSSGGLWGWE